MSWKNNFGVGKELIVATSSKNGKPNANIVISIGLVDDCILIANCQMKTTLDNLKANKKVSVIGGYYRINGTAKIFSSGKYFDLCVKKTKGFAIKNAILIKVNEVFDLDKVKKLV